LFDRPIGSIENSPKHLVAKQNMYDNKISIWRFSKGKVLAWDIWIGWYHNLCASYGGGGGVIWTSYVLLGSCLFLGQQVDSSHGWKAGVFAEWNLVMKNKKNTRSDGWIVF